MIIEEGVLRQALTIGFWVSFLRPAGRRCSRTARIPRRPRSRSRGRRFTRFLFSNTRAGLFWLPIRLFLGFAWLEAGWHKLTGGGWIDGGGSALAGYWTGAVDVPEQGPPADHLRVVPRLHQLPADEPHEAWFAWLITFGEIAVGIALLAGALTGVAAFFGAFMNMSFLLAGSASTNPVLFTMAIGLILAWRVAGYYGLDRYLLPALGAPWRPGRVFTGGTVTGSAPGEAQADPGPRPSEAGAPPSGSRPRFRLSGSGAYGPRAYDVAHDDRPRLVGRRSPPAADHA